MSSDTLLLFVCLALLPPHKKAPMISPITATGPIIAPAIQALLCRRDDGPAVTLGEGVDVGLPARFVVKVLETPVVNAGVDCGRAMEVL